jgi:histone demethylase JARID1
MHCEELLQQGRVWEKRAKEIMSADVVHCAQLEALSNQVQHLKLPVSRATYNMVDYILHKHRDAQKHVFELLQRVGSVDFRQRPKYGEMMSVFKKIEELNSKPNGALELEKEQKRHEDWMRRGKKLFGKTNAPLHILKSHMEYVLERNKDCFDTTLDKPRHPAEPSSRVNSPDPGSKPDKADQPGFREVFCICRKSEAGLMIECEVCHEW